MTNPILIECDDEQHWLAERSRGIGASEAESILGHGRETPAQVWARKKLERAGDAQPPRESAEWLEAGQFLEDGNARWYAKRHGRKVITPQEFYGVKAWALIVCHPVYPFIRCTPDRIIEPSGDPDFHVKPHEGVLQLKNTAFYRESEWQDENDKAITTPPLRVQIQVQQELLCTGFRWGAIGAVVGGNKRRDADVSAHSGFQAELLAALIEFWQSLEGDVMPPLAAGDVALMRERYPEALAGRTLELPRPELALEYARWRAIEAFAAEKADRCKAELMADLGDAEAATIGGEKVLTFKNRAEFTRPACVIPAGRTLRVDSLIRKQKTLLLENADGNPLLTR